MWLYFRFSSERVKLNCVNLSVNFGYLYLKKLSMNRKKRVWDKPYIYCVELLFIDMGILFSKMKYPSHEC